MHLCASERNICSIIYTLVYNFHKEWILVDKWHKNVPFLSSIGNQKAIDSVEIEFSRAGSSQQRAQIYIQFLVFVIIISEALIYVPKQNKFNIPN